MDQTHALEHCFFFILLVSQLVLRWMAASYVYLFTQTALSYNKYRYLTILFSLIYGNYITFIHSINPYFIALDYRKSSVLRVYQPFVLKPCSIVFCNILYILMNGMNKSDCFCYPGPGFIC